jgi:hypothetical protein
VTPRRRPDGYWRMVVRYWRENPGCSYVEIAVQLGCSDAYVRAVAKRRGMTFTHRRWKRIRRPENAPAH